MRSTLFASQSGTTMQQGSTNRAPDEGEDSSLIVQEVMHNMYPDDPTTAFFELANASCIRYRLTTSAAATRKSTTTDESIQGKKTDSTTKNSNNPKKRITSAHADDGAESSNRYLVISQNSQAQTHTGGVVWETSYLLLEYLLHAGRNSSMDLPVVGPNLIEVGAGCGLLGMALAATLPLQQVVLTETQEVLETILKPNVGNNQHIFCPGGMLPSSSSSPSPPIVSAGVLDWTNYRVDAQRIQDTLLSKESRKFDTIVGTDVVFSPKLVEPLLATLRFLAHERTIIYLCLQPDRCPKSFQLLQEKAPEHDFLWKALPLEQDEPTVDARCNASTTINSASPVYLKWAKELESKIVQLSVSVE